MTLKHFESEEAVLDYARNKTLTTLHDDMRHMASERFAFVRFEMENKIHDIEMVMDRITSKVRELEAKNAELREAFGEAITWLEEYYDATKRHMSERHVTEFLRWINTCRKIVSALSQRAEQQEDAKQHGEPKPTR